MEARLLSATLAVASVCLLGAAYRTTNFVVNAPTPELAKVIGNTAESYRRNLSQEWLGKGLPAWSQPCPITADVAPHKGAGGATSFMFENGSPFGWRMNIQGPRHRILDSVLPHEVTHTIFATHFGRPLPRWADEGACTTVEHTSERNKQEQLLVGFLTHRPTSRGIPFNRMFALKEYPSDILPLYSQGYSVARYLIGQGGKRKFVRFIGEGMQVDNWPQTTRKYYGFQTLGALQANWLAWVGSGSPRLVGPSSGSAVQVASGKAISDKRLSSNVRSQNARPAFLDTQTPGTSPVQPLAVPVRQLASQDREFSVANFQSWYVEQNEKASGRRPFSKARDVFYPVDPSNTLRGQALALPNLNGQAVMLPESLFDWNHPDRKPFQNRKSVRFDAPLSGAKTVWR